MQLTQKENLNVAVIVLATLNPHKIVELNALLSDVSVHVLSAHDAGFDEAIDETGATLEENALLKARAVARATNLPVIADDSGLEVDALNGTPGVYSARFAGPQCDAADNRRLLLKKLSGVEPARRTAQFRCVIAFVRGDIERTFEGVCRGSILTEERGVQGFGYDAVFLPEDKKQSLAELSPEEKNKISHRAKAMELFKAQLQDLLTPNP